jgi:hypothetical protein
MADADRRPALLPELGDGLTLLDVEGGRGVRVVQSLVLDHLMLNDGPAVWVDADGHATTATLARLAPGRRLLDRIHVARGFTAYQHYGAVCDLPTAAGRSDGHSTGGGATRGRGTDRGGERSPRTPSLVVAPAFDALYRADDTLDEADARTLQARGLARLAACARAFDAPVLLTRTADDEFAAPVEALADRRLRCEQTPMGARFVGDEFETLVYPVDGGAHYQTTFAYWRRVLGVRAERVSARAGPESPSASVDDAPGVGRGVVADGTSAALTADPLLDAWSGVAGAGGR